METAPAFSGFSCLDCGPIDAVTVDDRCRTCGGVVTIEYEHAEPMTAAEVAAEPTDQRHGESFLPFAADDVVSLGEGGTPLVSCPTLADELGVDRVLVKDEGRNPTGATVDRGLSLAVTAATLRGRETVALPTTGDGGQSTAAYAGRAGLGSRSFVPTRSSHLTKAMINVHGGDMRVVEGRFPDAVAAYEAWADGDDDGKTADEAGSRDVTDDGGGAATDDWAAVGPASPFRREGAKWLVHELCAQLSFEPPDVLVVPTGHGIGLAGARAALSELASHGLIDAVPGLVAAQPAGCAPIVRAIEGDGFGPWEEPDTIAGGLEVPDPVRGNEAVAAVQSTDGDAVAVPDDRILAAAVDATAATGVELGVAGGVGVAAALELSSSFDTGDTVVVCNPVAGGKESDVLRSELMGRGK